MTPASAGRHDRAKCSRGPATGAGAGIGRLRHLHHRQEFADDLATAIDPGHRGLGHRLTLHGRRSSAARRPGQALHRQACLLRAARRGAVNTG